MDFRITVPRGRVMRTAWRESFRRAGGVHHPLISYRGQCVAGRFGVHAGAARDFELIRVMAELVHPVAVRIQHQRDQQSELAIAQNGDCGGAGQRHLIQDFAGGRQRLDEDGALGGERIGQRVQVAFGQGQELAKRPGMVDDAEHGALRAMTAQAAPAPVARAAGQVDFADDAPADPLGRIGFDHFAHELVPGRAGEAVIAALQFEVGIADAAAEQADEREARGPVGSRLVRALRRARFPGWTASMLVSIIRAAGTARPARYN